MEVRRLTTHMNVNRPGRMHHGGATYVAPEVRRLSLKISNFVCISEPEELERMKFKCISEPEELERIKFKL